jgi:hypothetical protein
MVVANIIVTGLIGRDISDSNIAEKNPGLSNIRVTNLRC